MKAESVQVKKKPLKLARGMGLNPHGMYAARFAMAKKHACLYCVSIRLFLLFFLLVDCNSGTYWLQNLTG